MTKAEFIAQMKKLGQYESMEKAQAACDAFCATLREVLRQGDSITFTNFGAFQVSQRAARLGRNPRTGETIEIPANKAVRFKASKNFL